MSDLRALLKFGNTCLLGGAAAGGQEWEELNVRQTYGKLLIVWWAHLDSNQGPKDYESSALTN